ncbi:MAG TPA: hypothetical protein VGG01_11600 [Xanthobacteraceae bacterium]|jgi:hypothetical protein
MPPLEWKTTLSIAFVLGLVCAVPVGQIAQAQGSRDPANTRNLDDPANTRNLNDPDARDPANSRNLDDATNGRGGKEDGGHHPIDDKDTKRGIKQ